MHKIYKENCYFRLKSLEFMWKVKVYRRSRTSRLHFALITFQMNAFGFTSEKKTFSIFFVLKCPSHWSSRPIVNGVAKGFVHISWFSLESKCISSTSPGFLIFLILLVLYYISHATWYINFTVHFLFLATKYNISSSSPRDF